MPVAVAHPIPRKAESQAILAGITIRRRGPHVVEFSDYWDKTTLLSWKPAAGEVYEPDTGRRGRAGVIYTALSKAKRIKLRRDNEHPE